MRRHPTVLAVVLVLLIAGAGGSWVLWRRSHSGQASRIPTEGSSEIPASLPTPVPRRSAQPGEPRFVAAVSDDGRHFLDQYQNPILIQGDSPWSILLDLSPAQAELYFRN